MGKKEACPCYRTWLEREEFGKEYEDYFLEVSIMGFHSRVIGLSSRIPDTLTSHIFMLDTIPLVTIEQERLQMVLGNMSNLNGYTILMVRSSKKTTDINSYHIYIPHAFTKYQIKDLTFQLRDYADMLFFGLGQHREFWDLRISSKGDGSGDSPTLIRTYFPNPDRRYPAKDISICHWKVFEKFLEGLPPIPPEIMTFGNIEKVNEILMRYSV